MTDQFLKRLQSLAWRSSMVALAFALGNAGDVLMSMTIDPRILTLIGLILGEVSKYINKTYFPDGDIQSKG